LSEFRSSIVLGLFVPFRREGTKVEREEGKKNEKEKNRKSLFHLWEATALIEHHHLAAPDAMTACV
jgi:hypothetical protein